MNGAVCSVNPKMNKTYYGKEVAVKDIIDGRIECPYDPYLDDLHHAMTDLLQMTNKNKNISNSSFTQSRSQSNGSMNDKAQLVSSNGGYENRYQKENENENQNQNQYSPKRADQSPFVRKRLTHTAAFPDEGMEY